MVIAKKGHPPRSGRPTRSGPVRQDTDPQKINPKTMAYFQELKKSLLKLHISHTKRHKLTTNYHHKLPQNLL
jgi:hypothetical protein